MSTYDSLSQIQASIEKFAQDRDWDQFHTPKNLIMAATSEMGELAEVLQWKSEEEVIAYLSSEEGKTRLSEEISDVMIYLLRLSQKADIDIIDSLRKKLAQNELKYPVDLSKGNARKYTER
jgi:dCTP diphosphatase